MQNQLGFLFVCECSISLGKIYIFSIYLIFSNQSIYLIFFNQSIYDFFFFLWVLYVMVCE